jgi:prepilin signal peptidase PulO-like enzyme (type II secretory pathway)
MPPLAQVFVFAFGTVVGSFLNAALWRLRTGESFIVGRSYCPRCKHKLVAKDLVPLLSFALLFGKCRYCRRAISPAYPAIEAAVGALFLLFAIRAMDGGALSGAALARMLLDWYLAAVLVLVFVYDLRHMLILPSVTLPAAAIAFAGNVALGAHPATLAAGAAIAAGFFYFQHAVSRGRWIGGGDVHLGILMGAALGWKLALVALFIAYVSGAVFGSALILSGKTTMKGQVPFGTFLAAATLFAMLYGDRLLGWYLGMLR